MMTCAEFSALLDRAAGMAKAELATPTEAVMVAVEAQAKEAIGTYRYGWPELAESTQHDRVAAGYPADEPLLRTGSLAASIQHRAELTPEGAEGLVYSNDKIALYQELGTERGIPPRSFLYKSLWLATPVMARVFGEFAEKLFVR
jgi:hypothetical protein